MKRIFNSKENIIIISLTVLVIIGFFIDDFIVDLIHSIQAPPLVSFFHYITNPGFVVLLLLIITTLFMWADKKRGWIIPMWFSVAIAGIIGYIIKFIVARPRLIPQFILGIPDYSFPSFHAMFCFCLIPILDREYKALKWFWVSLGLLIAFSRMYLDLHYFSDVVAGIMLGYAIGHFVIFLRLKLIGAKMKKLVKKI